MTKLALITGITGQDGSYLSELLLEKNYKIYGIVRRTSSVYNYGRIEHIKNDLNLLYGDLTDSSITTILNQIIMENEDYEVLEIYNLGAQSHVQISFVMPEYTTMTDGLAVLKILEYIRNLPEIHIKKIKFYQAGTSEMYGKVLQVPQTEETPFNPQSPYACAKLYSHFTVNLYRDAYNLFACNGILFNHESPRRGDNFVTMKIIKGIKRMNIDNNKCITLGNLNSKRDWGHAKDYVNGMWLMLQKENPDNYVLSSNNCYSIKEFVEKAFKYVDLTITWKGEGLDEIGVDQDDILRIKVDKKYFRPCEVDYLLGDSSKAKRELNWIMEFDTLDKLIIDMFDK
jgi:GDPmannose 4,6-dehydratase|tara:strand:- start:962 stop:1987 length:1026 start_codon:yes stop_codon:yes gene_type:complete